MSQKLELNIYAVKKQSYSKSWIYIFLFAFTLISSQSANSQDCLSPSPTYTGPLYVGDTLTLFANPPGQGPYYFYWSGPNGFSSTEENPIVGAVDIGNSGIYNLQIVDENDCETNVDIYVEIVEDETGMQYDELSMNYKDFGMYPFDLFCSLCEDENSLDVIPSPEISENLSGSEKQTRPNVKGPPSCQTSFNSYSGNFFVQVPVLSISGLGPELSVEFVYNSCNSGINYGYGNGWTFNYNLVWEKHGSDIYIHRGDGREDIYQYNAGYYTSPKGISDTLINLGNDQFILRSKYGMEYHFADSTHRRLTKVSDQNNNELTINYADSLVTTITGACGRSLQFEYSEGVLIKIKDNINSSPRSVHFEYDPMQNMRKITDPMGYAEDFIYDIDHKIIQIIDKRKNIVRVEYNSNNAVKRLQSSISQINVSYDLTNNQTIVTQPVGGSIQTTTYSFDAEGRAIEINGSCCGFNIQYQYNSKNDITRITDAKGLEYNFTYDNRGNVLTETDPLNNIQEFQYDPQFSQLAYWKDKNGNITNRSYDASGNLTSIIFPDGGRLNYSYYDNGLLKTSTNGEGHTTSLAYNNLGNQITITHPIGTEFFGYDEIGNLIFSVTPNSDTTYYEYDARSQLVKTTDPHGNSNEDFYDPNGNKIWTQNKGGYITTRTYDAHNRLIKITKPLETVTEFSFDEKGNLISTKDPNGNETQFTYDQRNLKIAETNALGYTRSWEYDSNGKLVTETNFRGFSINYVYDALNRLTSTNDESGDTTTYQYDANGNNIAINSPDGISSTFQYNEMDFEINTQHAFNHSSKTFDKNGNLIEKQDGLGNSTNYEYDTNDRLITITDALGQQISYQYDKNGNLVAATDKMGNTSQTFYDALNQPVLFINTLGDSILTSYDELGNQKIITNERGFDTEFFYDPFHRRVLIQYPIGTQSFDYDKNGNQINKTDALGRNTSFEFDVINQIIKIIHPDGSSLIQSYDENGNTISIKNEENETNRYSYNALDRIVSHTNAENETSTFTYDNLGNQIITTLPSGNIIHNVYDQESRLTATYDKLGGILKNTYDILGNIIIQSDGNGNSVTHQYDVLQRKIATTDQKGDLSQFTFDPNNNLIQSIDREGNITLRSYNELNQPISQNNGLGKPVSYSFDKAGNLIMITDANGNITEYEYDGNDRQIKETHADGTTKEYTYDNFGNIISRKDNRGFVTSYDYNERNRLVFRNYPDNNDDSFSYDATGRMISASNTNATIFLGYDKAGRVLFETLNNNSTSFTYDVPAQKRTITYSNGNLNVVEIYDKRGRLNQLQRNGNAIVNWYYDGANRQMCRAYINGTKSQFSYNTMNWVTSLRHYNSNNSFIHLDYSFDKEGNKQQEDKIHLPDRSESYTYDDNYRLTGFQRGNLATGNFSNQSSYDYDPLGNRQQVIKDGISTEYSSNEMNEYNSISGMSSPIYDNNGNLMEDGTINYQYDFENRLISVDNDSLTTYKYDPLGRRISKTSNIGTIEYFYDRDRVIEEKDGLGTLLVSYLYGNGIDDILVMQKEGNDYYYHKNSLNSVIAITNASGVPVEYYEYDVYGKVTFRDDINNVLSASAIGNPYLYTGRRLDDETGLYYYRARDYDAINGRFIQRDPLGYVDGMNLYEYVGSNPTNLVDPFGLDFENLGWGWGSLPSGMGGLTNVYYNAVVVCRCDENSKYAHMYVVSAHIKTRIVIRRHYKKPRYRFDENGRDVVQGIYGHEMQHVKSIKTAVNAAMKPRGSVQKEINRCQSITYSGLRACIADLPEWRRKIMKALKAVVDDAAGHDDDDSTLKPVRRKRYYDHTLPDPVSKEELKKQNKRLKGYTQYPVPEPQW